MAHSVECKICGCYEAAHEFPRDYPETVGHNYKSSDPKFEAAMWRKEKQDEERDRRPVCGQVWILTHHGLVDIGS